MIGDPVKSPQGIFRTIRGPAEGAEIMGSFEIGAALTYRLILPGAIERPGVPRKMRIGMAGKPEKVDILSPLGMVPGIKIRRNRSYPDGSYGGGKTGIQGKSQPLGFPDPGKITGDHLPPGMNSLIGPPRSHHSNLLRRELS
jgi:hypothetical protein